MTEHAIDSMIYAWTAMKEKEATQMIDYINFGEVVNVNTYLTSSFDDVGSHVIIDFLADDSVNFNRLQNDISKLLEHQRSYVLCTIEDVIEARREFSNLKDRVKELEDQLADTKKETDKKLCEAYMGMTETFYKSADKLISIDKMIAELKKERDYWKDRFGSVVIDVSKVLEANGVEFTVKAIDGNKWNVAIDIPELNEMKAKVADLERKLEAAKFNDYHNLKKSQEKKWSAMLQALKEKGVEVLYMGEENDKPNIDVKIPEIGDLKKELKDLKSKTVAEARYEWKDGGFALIYTMCDGSKKNARMDLSESIDATSISCGTVPMCKTCKNHRYFGNTFGHYCRIPNSNYIIPGMFDMYPLTDEEAAGPACGKFEAKKEG